MSVHIVIQCLLQDLRKQCADYMEVGEDVCSVLIILVFSLLL